MSDVDDNIREAAYRIAEYASTTGTLAASIAKALQVERDKWTPQARELAKAQRVAHALALTRQDDLCENAACLDHRCILIRTALAYFKHEGQDEP